MGKIFLQLTLAAIATLLFEFAIGSWWISLR
jgi:hypothetical protein